MKCNFHIWRTRGYVLVSLGFVIWCASRFSAKAVVDANSRANTNAPPDGAPWGNVGTVNGGSGVYVANGWVLTAAHVGFGSFTLGTTTYAYDGNYHQLTNSDGTVADLLMFHLSTPPNAPNVALVSNSPVVSSAVDMIGFGYYSGSAQMTFGSYTGFSWGSQAKSWGNNQVAATGLYMSDGVANVMLFETDFTSPGPSQTSDEGQAAVGDSGGGVFQLTGSGWQLTGIMLAIGTFPSQPGGTAVYGNATFSADVATYRSQAIALLGSTPPVLSISQSGANVRVCWADIGVTNILERTTTLSPPSWTTVTQAQVLTNGQISVIVPATYNSSLFRLQKYDASPGVRFGRVGSSPQAPMK